jgi:hypothetical protein
MPAFQPTEEHAMAKILIITGDGGEAYETLYAFHSWSLI